MMQEQLQLVADGTMQRDLAVRPAAHLDSFLELLLIGRAHGDCERRPQERGTARRLQMRQQVPRLLGALVPQVGDSLVPVRLGPHDLIGILDPATSNPQGQLVRQVARGQRDVDGERQGL